MGSQVGSPSGGAALGRLPTPVRWTRGAVTVSELRLGKGLGIQASRLGGYATLCFMLRPPPVSDVSCPEDHYDCILRLPGTS